MNPSLRCDLRATAILEVMKTLVCFLCSVFCIVSGFNQTTVEQLSSLDGAGYERSSMPPTPGPTNEPSPTP